MSLTSPMPPPWLRYPGVSFASIHWRTGAGEDYVSQLGGWLRSLSPADRAEYQRLFPAPKTWPRYYQSVDEDARLAELADLEIGGVQHWEPHGARRYTRDSLKARCAAGEQPSYIMFWKPGEPGTEACLGQWQPSQFTVDGQTYGCTEQYMMAEKARLFDDEEMERAIMATDDPATMKRLGRKVRGFDAGMWGKAKHSIVLNGNYAKFSQDPDLRSYLTGTGDAVLVEASPLDTVWGIGLGANNERATDPARWRGANLLGFALMETRDEIARVWAHADLL
ncbi:MAG: NADAR family protein [Micrococcales bacterium]|nr:NADAR family protein [Micrococcales bacterium]